MAQLAATKKARRRSQPLPARKFAHPEEGAGAAVNAKEKGEKGKGKRERRLSLGLLTIGRVSTTGPSIPSPPPPLPSGTASASASHYIPHSQTPAGRESAESTRAAHAHVKTVAHRHSADVSAPAKLQKKTRPGHARTQSATSISSTSSFTAGLNSGPGGGVVPPSSFTQHRGRLSADMDSRRTWTPSPSPSRTHSLPLLSTFGSSHRDSAAAPHTLLSESPSTLKPGFLQSAHASGIALALTEAEALVLARSAAEILGLHEQLVKQLDEALQQVHYELPDSAENVEEAVKVVCRIFAGEVSSLVHFST